MLNRILWLILQIFGWVPKTSTSNYTKNDLKIECVKWPRFEVGTVDGDDEHCCASYL